MSVRVTVVAFVKLFTLTIELELLPFVEHNKKSNIIINIKQGGCKVICLCV